ncbi:MAG: ribosome maturation factor RimM [Deltaproteobacteria bacterium]|jgi:16S rRNA processing protein RimM|nr:ribosome maturation factor RimM [Deltaproteobacteria bacterium]
MDDLMDVGHIAKAHGVKGEIRIVLNADSLDLLRPYIYLADRSRADCPLPAPSASLSPRAVKNLRLHQGRPLLLLEGVDDREAAEQLRQKRILVPRQRLPRPGAGEIYLRDLPGLAVLVRGGEGAFPLGCLERVDVTAGQEIWTIVTPQGKEVLFPAVEAFAPEIDPVRRTAVISPPPGLLELYLGSDGKE